jgi:hypothetical protein
MDAKLFQNLFRGVIMVFSCCFQIFIITTFRIYFYPLFSQAAERETREPVEHVTFRSKFQRFLEPPEPLHGLVGLHASHAAHGVTSPLGNVGKFRKQKQSTLLDQ